ncbi:MAG: ABC transporter permease [Verrucomicrobiales bacterium]|nr:ABC transporter permease [Verrucomicrobiales bacterium]
MRAVDKKIFRDLGRMKGQVVAIAAVIGCGIAIFIGWQTTSVSLQNGLDSYYERQRFADVFTSMNRAPLAIESRVKDIPGVAAVDLRIVESVTLHIEGLSEPAVGRLISLPDRGVSKLNGVHLVQGRFPEYGKPGEIVAEEAFVNANGFSTGDSVTAVMNGRMQKLRIVGVGMSPEYLTTLQPGSPFPDDKRFGIFWMRRHEMETAFDMDGSVNDLAISLHPGASGDEVILHLDRLLDKYGSLGANDRDRQLSHRFISDELAQLKAMTLIPPSIFLGVAAFLLNVVLRRILSMQRTQIASLKAFGYSSLEVGIHYGKMMGLVILGGAVFGCLVGSKMGQGLTNLYVEFYRFPGTVFQVDWMAYVTGVSLSFIAGFVGVFGAVSQAVKIQPAEAMRPEPPPVYKLMFFEKWGLHHWMSRSSRMIVREIVRRPLKASLTTLGIAFGCAVVVIGNFGKDAIDYLVDSACNSARM